MESLKAKKVAGQTITFSILFWIITNFFCWPGNPAYTQDSAGLADSYFRAIPFLGNVAGDLCFAAIFFGGYRFIEERSLRTVKS
jgi:hypothetical protein